MPVHTAPVTPIGKFVTVYTSNSTNDTALAAPTVGTAAPTTDGTTGYVRAPEAQHMIVVVRGTDAANETVNVDVLGVGQNLTDSVYPELPLVSLVVTLGTTASGTGTANETYGDLISKSAGISAYVSSNIVASGTFENYIGWFSIPCLGFEWYRFRTDRGTAASANVEVMFT